MKWRARNGVLLLFLAGIMVPLQMVLLPLFTVYFKAHLIDNLLSLIITYTAFGLPLSIFLMVGYFRVVPREIIDAAAIDGAGIFRTFWQVVRAHGAQRDPHDRRWCSSSSSGTTCCCR